MRFFREGLALIRGVALGAGLMYFLDPIAGRRRRAMVRDKAVHALYQGEEFLEGAMEDLVKNQEQAQWTLEKLKAGHPTESHHVMARVSHFQELEKLYIPGSEDRIKSSHGFDDHRAH